MKQHIHWFRFTDMVPGTKRQVLVGAKVDGVWWYTVAEIGRGSSTEVLLSESGNYKRAFATHWADIPNPMEVGVDTI